MRQDHRPWHSPRCESPGRKGPALEAPTAFVSTAGELYLTALIWADTAAESLFGAAGGVAPQRAAGANGHPHAIGQPTAADHEPPAAAGPGLTFGAGHGHGESWARRAARAVAGFVTRLLRAGNR